MKKSLKKQAVFPVLMLLVVTALALIGSSFAWFSMNSVATVDQVTGKVEDSSVGLMISQDATNFTGSIRLNQDAATFVNPYRFHQMSTTMPTNGSPVNPLTFFEATITKKNPNGTAALIYTTASTHNPVEGATAGQLAGWFNNNGTVKLDSGEQSREVSGTTYYNQAGFMVFDLFFSVENASTLYLNVGTAFSQTNSAFRVAFLDYGFVPTATATAATAIALSTLDNDGITIWDPAGQSSYYGITRAEGNSLETSFEPYVAGANSAQVTTYPSASLYPQPADQSTPAVSWSETNEPSNSIRPVAVLGAGVNKLRVVVWLEGNDATCTSAVANTNMSLDLSFWAKKNPTS